MGACQVNDGHLPCFNIATICRRQRIYTYLKYKVHKKKQLWYVLKVITYIKNKIFLQGWLFVFPSKSTIYFSLFLNCQNSPMSEWLNIVMRARLASWLCESYNLERAARREWTKRPRNVTVKLSIGSSGELDSTRIEWFTHILSTEEIAPHLVIMIIESTSN